MPRRMSCSLTIDAVRARTKTETRRRAETWRDLEPGDRLVLVEKAMGLPKGARQVVLAEVEVVDVRLEPISAITAEAIEREGVRLDLTPAQWARWWKREHGIGVTLNPPVRVISWRYIDAEEG